MEVFWQAGKPALRGPPSAVPHSFIRSPFVDGLLLLTGWKACATASAVYSAVCRPRSAVSIPHSLTVCSSSQAGKPPPPPSAVRGLHSPSPPWY